MINLQDIKILLHRQILSKSKVNLFLFIGVMFVIMNLAYANPDLNNIAAGNVSITQMGTSTTVNQASSQAILNWNSFNIGANESTHFQQPVGGVALNRIDPSKGASQIYGQLSATGSIILINGAGIHFGPDAMVNVGGIIASTSNVSDANFLAGKFVFDQPSTFGGAIINEGFIRAANSGLVALLGSNVSNTGIIQAELGTIVLGSGNKFTLDFSGDQLINFSVDEEAALIASDENGQLFTSGVANTGSLLADGGKVLVSVKVAEGVLDHAINMAGIVEAKSVSSSNGVIILSSGEGDVNVSGILNVSSKDAGTKAGAIKVLGKNVKLTSTAKLNADGDIGGGTILIGGNFYGAGPEQNALNTTVDAGAILSANAITSGDGGKIAVWSDNYTQFYGSIYAEGGALSGNGGFSEVSGHQSLQFKGKVNLKAPNGATGELLLDPENIIIQNSGSTDATASGSPIDTYTSDVNNSILTISDLQDALMNANVLVQTGSGGAQLGDITLNDALTWNSGNTLTLAAANQIIINNQIVGDGIIFNAANGIILNTDSIITTGNQEYNNAVTLNAIDMTLDAGMSSIIFNSTVDGASNLTLYSSASMIFFENNVGSLVPLLSLTTNADVQFTLPDTTGSSINMISTTGNQSYTDLHVINLFSPPGSDYSLNLTAQNINIAGDVSRDFGDCTICSLHLVFETTGSTSRIDGALTKVELTKNGSGTLTLEGSAGTDNDYIRVNDGLLRLVDAVLTSSSGMVIHTGGQLELVNSTVDFAIIEGGLSLEANSSNLNTVIMTGNSTISANSLYLTGDVSFGDSGNLTINGQLYGDNLIMNGSGELTLNLTERTGSTTVNSGSVIVASNEALGFAPVTVNSGGTLNLDNVTISDATFYIAGTGVDGLGALVSTGNSAIENGSVNLFDNATIGKISGSDVFVLNTYIDGDFGLTLAGVGTMIIGGPIGSGTPLASLTSNVTNLSLLNGNGVQTNGTQTYNSAITINADTTFTLLGAGNIAINNGISNEGAGSSITLTGATDNDFTLAGSLSVLNVNVTGLSGSNSLTVQTNNSQNWTINAVDSGDITGIAEMEIGGTFIFSNIQNVSGSNIENNFILSGGALSGSVNGGSGVNTLFADANASTEWAITGVNSGTMTGIGSFSNIQNLVGGSNDNTFTISGGGTLSGAITGSSGGTNSIIDNNNANTWNIIGSDSGNITGVGSFNTIQNLIGSNGDNTFIFSDNASISGKIDTSLSTGVNSIDYSAYTSAITTTLTADHVGFTATNLGATINSFLGIQNLIGNNDLGTFNIDSPGKVNTIHLTGPLQGFVNDPTYFSQYQTFTSTGNTTLVLDVPGTYSDGVATIDGVAMDFVNIQYNEPAPAPTPDPAPVPAAPSSPAAVTSTMTSPQTSDQVATVTFDIAAKNTITNTSTGFSNYYSNSDYTSSTINSNLLNLNTINALNASLNLLLSKQSAMDISLTASQLIDTTCGG